MTKFAAVVANGPTMAEVEGEAGGDSDGGGKSVATWAGGIPVSTSFPWICGAHMVFRGLHFF